LAYSLNPIGIVDVRETLIDLAAGHEAHGFALNYFPLPMGGRAVDRSPVYIYVRS
jgi:hypothetical protein